jgi:putative phosphoribosyl transferase
VLAIPRGAVPMGALIARRLGGDLDLVLVRKLHAPGAPEFAIGAVDESGWVYLAPHAIAVGATSAYVNEQKMLQLEELARRRELYTPGRPRTEAAGRTVIVVDRLVCAVPVASEESLKLVGGQADEVVCLEAPYRFRAVSQFYASFPQLEDEEVVSVLREARGEGGNGGRAPRP